MVDDIKNSFERFRQFLLHDIWEIDISSLSARRSLPIRLLRVGQLVFKGFKEDDLPIHAAALTFVTLMSLVPMLAVAFALLRGFGFGQEKLDALLVWVQEMPSEYQQFIEQVLGIVKSTNVAAMGWVGLGFVVFTAVLVLGSCEMTFDKIWGVPRSRNVLRKTANYISILVLVPLLIGVAGTIETSLHGAVHVMPEQVGTLLRGLLRLTSFFSTWLAFFCLFMFLPNTRVHAGPAVLSSFSGALLWLLWQKAFITLQIGVARYNAIYGTFASVPIFLAWLYTSWVIILLGAELAFALQNSTTYQMESVAESASSQSRLMLSLAVIVSTAEAMAGDGPSFSAPEFAKEHRVPIRLLNDLVRMLVRVGLLAETAGRENSYVLLKSADTLRVKDVVDMVLEEGAKPDMMGIREIAPAVEQVLGGIDEGIREKIGDSTIKDLMEKQAAAA